MRSSTTPCRDPGHRHARRVADLAGRRQTISFSGHATDGQGAAIPPAACRGRWSSTTARRTAIPIRSSRSTGVASGSFAAPDHDYPSYLELVLTATDSSAPQDQHVSVRLDPRTVDLTFRTVPVGLSLVAIGTQSETVTPFIRTVIVSSAPGLDRADPADRSAARRTPSAPGPTAGRPHTRSSPPRRPRPTPPPSPPAARRLPVGPAYTVTANGWGPVEKDRSNGEQPAGDGLPLTLAGVVYPEGPGHPRRLATSATR